MNVLVDTSVWSLALRRRSQNLSSKEVMFAGELTDLVRDGRAVLIGLVRQELLSGIKTDTQFEALRKTLRAFPDEPVETADHEAAAKFSNACRAEGIAISLTDILICAIAVRRGMSVFTTDPDFVRYARVVPLKLHVDKF